MQSTTTSFLQTTEELLKKAFPNGMEDDLYFPLLNILEPELSDRNLATVISNFSGKEYHIVLNDIYKVKAQSFENDLVLDIVQSLLDVAGFQQWLEED